MKKVMLIGFISIFIIGCAGNRPKDDDFPAQFDYGKSLLEKEKYLKAQEVFQSLVLKASHTDLGDDVLFYLGESYFLNDEYLLAISEFDRLTRRMGFSPYVEKARWRICESFVYESPKYFHDQSYTENAIDKLQEFMEDYPDSEFRHSAQKTIMDLREKLGKKVYETGILYIKLGAFDSAILAFEEILSKYYDTSLVEKTQVKIVESYCKLSDISSAKDYFDSIHNQLTTKNQKQLETLLSETENELNRKSK